MTWFEKILQVFKSKNKPSVELPDKVPTRGKLPKDTEPIKDIPVTKVRIKYLSKMLNSITLSSDMKMIYLIDNHRAIEFSLETDEGVIIGEMQGQLAVVSAIGSTGDDRTKERRVISAKKLPLKNTQWTMSFNGGSKIMAIIGATDIDIGIADQDDNPVCKQYTFNLKMNYLKIRRTATELLVEVIDK